MSGSETSDREFEVERVLNHRRQAGKLQYLIRWKDFGEEEDSWEPVENLVHCHDLVAFYNRRLYSPASPGSSSTTLTSSLSPVTMPAKLRSRSRSSSRSRASTKSKKASSTSSRGSSSSPGRRPTRTTTTTTTKTEVKKQSGSRSSPSRSSPARTGRSPTRSTPKSTAQSRLLDVVKRDEVVSSYQASPRSVQRDLLSRTPIKDTRLSRFDEDLASRRAVRGSAVQQSEVVVQRSWTSTQSASSEVRGRGRAAAIEQSFSDDDDEVVEGEDDQQDQVDSESTSWFGQKRQEMLRSFQTRTASGFPSQQRDSAVEPLRIQDGSGWSFSSCRPLKTLGIRNQDFPIIVFIACLITIGVTFLIEEYF